MNPAEQPAIRFLSYSTTASSCLAPRGTDSELETMWKGMILA
jgi:hypothetical protein